MRIVQHNDDTLEILIELPRFIVWFMLLPLLLAGGFFTLVQLLGGDIVDALISAILFALLTLAGRYFLTQQTRLWLDAREDRVRILRTSMLNRRMNEFALAHLEAAETRTLGRQGGAGDSSASSHTLELVFSHTRPATRIPMSTWAVSGGGAGMLANAINDWLRAHRAGQ